MNVVIGADALYRAYGPGSELGTRSIGHAKIHRHPNEYRVEARQIVVLHSLGTQGSVEKCGYPLVRLGAAVGTRKHLVYNLAEFGIMGLASGCSPVSRS